RAFGLGQSGGGSHLRDRNRLELPRALIALKRIARSRIVPLRRGCRARWRARSRARAAWSELTRVGLSRARGRLVRRDTRAETIERVVTRLAIVLGAMREHELSLTRNDVVLR